MKLGAVSFMTDYSIAPGEFARELEGHGYESIWVGDHSHIPISQKDVGTDVSGEPMQEYKHLLDPFVTLSLAAAATKGLKLGTGMLLLAQRDPIQTAKSAASLDFVSGGRLLFGVASGWNTKELRNHGTDPAMRWPVLCERIDAVREIWARDIAEQHGDHVDFGPLASWPKPVQTPLPVIVGCDPENLHRVVAHGDEWAPLVANWAPGKLAGHIRELGRLAAEAGRAPIPVTVFRLVLPVRDLEVGSPLVMDEAELHAYAEAGAHRVVVLLPPWREKLLPLLEHYARLRLSVGTS